MRTRTVVLTIVLLSSLFILGGGAIIRLEWGLTSSSSGFPVVVLEENEEIVSKPILDIATALDFDGLVCLSERRNTGPSAVSALTGGKILRYPLKFPIQRGPAKRYWLHGGAPMFPFMP